MGRELSLGLKLRSNRDGMKLGLMPNGDDKSFVRLLLVCARYRARYGAWPTRVDVSSGVRQVLESILPPADLVAIERQVEIGTDPSCSYPRASSIAGTLEYESSSEISANPDAARAWLGIDGVRHLDMGTGGPALVAEEHGGSSPYRRLEDL